MPNLCPIFLLIPVLISVEPYRFSALLAYALANQIAGKQSKSDVEIFYATCNNSNSKISKLRSDVTTLSKRANSKQIIRLYWQLKTVISEQLQNIFLHSNDKAG